MIYFVSFTLLVLISGVIYLSKKSLKLAIGIPLALFISGIIWYVFTARANQSVSTHAQLLFFLGTPMVLFATLLGPYLVEKFIIRDWENEAETEEDSHKTL